MQYEITLSGRRGAENEEWAREIVRLLVAALKGTDVSYNLDIWDTQNNVAVMSVHEKGNRVPQTVTCSTDGAGIAPQ